MNRRWENDGIFVSMTGRVVKVVQYGSRERGTKCLAEDQRTGETFVVTNSYDVTPCEESFNEMEILALMASDEPIRL